MMSGYSRWAAWTRGGAAAFLGMTLASVVTFAQPPVAKDGEKKGEESAKVAPKVEKESDFYQDSHLHHACRSGA